MQGVPLEKFILGTFNFETRKNKKYSVFKGTLKTIQYLTKGGCIQ